MRTIRELTTVWNGLIYDTSDMWELRFVLLLASCCWRTSADFIAASPTDRSSSLIEHKQVWCWNEMRLRNGTVATVLVFITTFLSLSWYTAWQNGKEKLIAYQREFHALKERLRIAEHRTLQRSSELNAILEQFRRAVAETNGSKNAMNNFSGTYCVWANFYNSAIPISLPTTIE